MQPKVLIVDDDAPTVKHLKKALEKYHPDWLVFTAESPSAAKEQIRKTPYDAIITDWKFSEDPAALSGKSLIKAARQKDPLCVVIVMTAYQQEFDRYKDAYELGAYDCISKTQQGIVVSQEIAFKTAAALRMRQLHIEGTFYGRHIDRKLKEEYGTVEERLRLSSRWVTIAFVDIRGFSAISEQMREWKVIVSGFLQEFYGEIVRCAHKHNGVVDKFLGDGAMLLFGAIGEDHGVDGTAHAVNAVKMSLELQTSASPILDRFRERCEGVHAGDLKALSLGIGVNTAEVLVGIVRTQERDQFTAIGHGVNLAQRFESVAGKAYKDGTLGNILITRTVQKRLAGAFTLKQEPDLEDLKHINARHPVWCVVGYAGEP